MYALPTQPRPVNPNLIPNQTQVAEMMSNKENEEFANLEAKNYKYWTEFYGKENERMKAHLKHFGLNAEDLIKSEKCAAYLEKLVSMAQKLKLEDVNDTSYLIALSDLFKEKTEKDLVKFHLSNESQKLNDKILKLNVYNETLNKDLNKLNAEMPEDKKRLSEMETNLQYMRSKLDKYKIQLEQLESQNKTIDGNLMHENIVNDYKNLELVHSQIQAIQSKLDLYQDLPANMPMAKLKLQTIKNEIAAIDRRIEERMNLMS